MNTNMPKNPQFSKYYRKHQKCLKLNGLQPKTVEAYSRAIRRIGNYFDCRIDNLTADQLLDYFSDFNYPVSQLRYVDTWHFHETSNHRKFWSEHNRVGCLSMSSRVSQRSQMVMIRKYPFGFQTEKYSHHPSLNQTEISLLF